MRFEQEIDVMKKRWGETLERDPYYNPNLTILTEDYSFSFPPRVNKPWRCSHPRFAKQIDPIGVKD